MRYSQDPRPRVGDPQMGGQLQSQRFSPRNKGSELRIRFLSLGVLHWKDEPPELLALKAVGLTFRRTRGM